MVPEGKGSQPVWSGPMSRTHGTVAPAGPTEDPLTADLARPDPFAFQQASMLMLVFRFRGRRKLVASRLMESDDFVAELRAHLPVLARHYRGVEVSGVEVVSYQHGRFYTDPWPDALRLIQRLSDGA